MSRDRIVAVGFLTQLDLDLLGQGFRRHFPVDQEDVFADLLTQLDQIEIVPLRTGVALKQKFEADGIGQSQEHE